EPLLGGLLGGIGAGLVAAVRGRRGRLHEPPRRPESQWEGEQRQCPKRCNGRDKSARLDSPSRYHGLTLPLSCDGQFTPEIWRKVPPTGRSKKNSIFNRRAQRVTNRCLAPRTVASIVKAVTHFCPGITLKS